MRRATSKNFRFASLFAGVLLALAIAGCEGDDGAPGADGADGVDGVNGVDGADGASGVACWDLNGNGVEDPEEDSTPWTAMRLPVVRTRRKHCTPATLPTTITRARNPA